MDDLICSARTELCSTGRTWSFAPNSRNGSLLDTSLRRLHRIKCRRGNSGSGRIFLNTQQSPRVSPISPESSQELLSRVFNFRLTRHPEFAQEGLTTVVRFGVLLPVPIRLCICRSSVDATGVLRPRIQVLIVPGRPSGGGNSTLHDLRCCRCLHGLRAGRRLPRRCTRCTALGGKCRSPFRGFRCSLRHCWFLD